MDCGDRAAGGLERMSAYEPLGLHVPKPAVRPGDKPDFSGVKIARAGTVKRPPVDVAPEDIRDLGYTIIRVLNRDAEAVGPWAGTLSDAEDRKSVVSGKSVSVRVDIGGRRIINKNKDIYTSYLLKYDRLSRYIYETSNQQ